MKKIKSFVFAITLLVASQISQAQTTAPIDSIPATFKASLNELFNRYMKIENALLKGETMLAGQQADTLNKLIAVVKTSGLTKEQLKIVNKQFGKILHNSEHIRDNSKNYDHQCEHFDYLTDSFYKLLKSFKFSNTKIYYNYTADGNGGNSAHWLTDKDEMKDPYFKGAIRTGDKRVETL